MFVTTLEMDNLDCTKTMHISKKFTACLQEGHTATVDNLSLNYVFQLKPSLVLQRLCMAFKDCRWLPVVLMVIVVISGFIVIKTSWMTFSTMNSALSTDNQWQTFTTYWKPCITTDNHIWPLITTDNYIWPLITTDNHIWPLITIKTTQTTLDPSKSQQHTSRDFGFHTDHFSCDNYKNLLLQQLKNPAFPYIKAQVSRHYSLLTATWHTALY